MAREYSVTIPGLASLTTAPFLQLAPPATTPIQILRLSVTQEASVTSAQAVITVMRRSSASTLPTAMVQLTSGPAAISEGDPTSLLTGSTTTNAYGIATVTGTAGNVLVRDSFNVLNGYLYLPVPEERITVKPSGFLTLQFANSPPAVTWDVTLVFAELA